MIRLLHDSCLEMQSWLLYVSTRQEQDFVQILSEKNGLGFCLLFLPKICDMSYDELKNDVLLVGSNPTPSFMVWNTKTKCHSVSLAVHWAIGQEYFPSISVVTPPLPLLPIMETPIKGSPWWSVTVPVILTVWFFDFSVSFPLGRTFSYVGFTPTSKKVTATGNLDITLQENSQVLDEVVVIYWLLLRRYFSLSNMLTIFMYSRLFNRSIP